MSASLDGCYIPSVVGTVDNYRNMESSMSASSLSFGEDEFDNSTDNEIRLVDIEKEILSKKADDSCSISTTAKFPKEESEKENIHQKMLHITNLGLRPKHPNQNKVFAIKSQVGKTISGGSAVKPSTAPVKHWAYRSVPMTTKSNIPMAVTPVNTSTTSGSGKVKYFATKSNSDNSAKLTNNDSNRHQGDTSPPAIESMDFSTPPNSFKELSTDPKHMAVDETNLVSSSTKSMDSEDELPSRINNEASEIPNLNNIEIIDESGSEEDSTAAKKTETTVNMDGDLAYDENEQPPRVSKTEVKKNIPRSAVLSNRITPALKNTSVTKSQLAPQRKPVATRTAPENSKSTFTSKAATSPFRSIAPKPVSTNAATSRPISVVKSTTPNESNMGSSSIATNTNTTSTLSSPLNATKTNANVKGKEVTMSGKNVIMHSGTSIMPQSDLTGRTSITQSLNFVVPKDDIIKCKMNNTPLVLSVPPLISADGTQISPPSGRNLLMILPQQLPSQLQGSGVVNFLVSNPHYKPNVSVQICCSPRKMPPLSLLETTTNLSTNKPSPTPAQKSQLTSATEEVKILNTKEKDGPNWCWYVPRFGKRDLEGFLYKDRLGFSKTETERARKCWRKLNIAIYKKQLELDNIASNIIRIKRGIKPMQTEKPAFSRRTDQKFPSHTNRRSTQKGSSAERHEATSKDVDGTNQIKIVSVASLSEQNEDGAFLLPEEQTDSPTMPMDAQSEDDGSSDLYFTKKVVILRNRNPNSYKRKTKRIGRLPKIKLRAIKSANQNSQKLKISKPPLPRVKKCSVVLSRDETLEKVIREKFDLKDRSRRKRKLDLESMGLIKKVRRRNAIDTPLNDKPKILTKCSKPGTGSTVTDENKVKQDEFVASTSGSSKIVPEKPPSITPGHQKGLHKITSKTKIESSKMETNSTITNEDNAKQTESATSSSSSLKIVSEKNFDLTSGHQKSMHTDYKKSVIMSYRERQKISNLTHTERRFIFALNTIHILDDLRLDDKKPLLVLDQFNTIFDEETLSVRFNFKFDFESMNNYNVVFVRDDDEALPLPLLRNLELVYLVRHGHIKVVSRPVLCKYFLEKCNLVKKPVEKMQPKQTQPKSKDTKKAIAEKTIDKRDSKDNDGNKKRTIKVRNDLISQKHSSSPSVNTIEEHKKGMNIDIIKATKKSTTQIPQKSRLSQKPEGKLNYSVKSTLKHKTDSLDTKFNEIEKNLSMMFEKTKPSTPDISKEKPNVNHSFKNKPKNSNPDRKLAVPDEVLHSQDAAADLDYLFSNSGDENSNLDKNSEKINNSMPNASKEPELGEKQQSKSPKNEHITEDIQKTGHDEDGVVENLNDMLISSVNEAEQIQEIVDHDQDVEKSKENVETLEQSECTEKNFKPSDTNVNSNIVFLEEDDLVSTTINYHESKEEKTSKDTTEDKENGDSNTISVLMQMVPVPTSLDETTKTYEISSGHESESQDQATNKCTKQDTEEVQQDIQQDIESESKNLPDTIIEDKRAYETQKQDSALLGDPGADPSTPEEIEGGATDSEKFDAMANASEGTYLQEKGVESENLDIEQFLTKPSDDVAHNTSLVVEDFLSRDKEDITEKICLLQSSGGHETLKHTQVCDSQIEMEVDGQVDSSENINEVEHIFKDSTLSEQQNVSIQSDPIIPQDNLMYLMPEKSGDSENIPAGTSSDVSMSTLQVTPSNIADVEDSSKISYTETSFGSNEGLNDHVTENLINSSNEFELFNDTSDKVADDSTSIASGNLVFGDCGTNDPESSIIILDSKKSTESDLLSSCEMDTDIAMCSDEISKNLPDDYLEK